MRINTKRKSKVKILWTKEFAYVVGLITTDGNLSPDKRHISFTSKDLELVRKFKACLDLSNKIGKKARGGEYEKKYYVIQFGDVNFYNYLLGLGLKPAKSSSLGKLRIPKKFFYHFLRGCIDGDGNISVVAHPESKHPQLRLRLYSASPVFLDWIYLSLKRLLSTEGGWIDKKNFRKIYALVFAKHDSLIILKAVYRNCDSSCYLNRKFMIAKPLLGG